jgi:hypothetical protein
MKSNQIINNLSMIHVLIVYVLASFQFIMTDHLRETIWIIENDSNRVDDNQRLLKALLLVALLHDLDISHDLLDDSLIDTIHRALLLSPDTRMRTCEQLDFLESVIQPSMKL